MSYILSHIGNSGNEERASERAILAFIIMYLIPQTPFSNPPLQTTFEYSNPSRTFLMSKCLHNFLKHAAHHITNISISTVEALAQGVCTIQ